MIDSDIVSLAMLNTITSKTGEFSLRYLLDDTGEPWFFASDVARMLDFDKVTPLIKRIDEEDRRSRLTKVKVKDRSGRVVPRQYINEVGLYTAFLGSNKPVAKKLKRFLLDEVLPTIRKQASPAFTEAHRRSVMFAGAY
ncbi:Bro-N domain-containing protein [Thiococcus pfennigii]|uniref:BRO-N domain-containing protein n=1 Tax=Thiococcus pfennigii TaxID=1057 RepID=UPI0019089FDE|nr:BRO family protein [Thiococcus pfennigii]